jgi:hypothetical protein
VFEMGETRSNFFFGFFCSFFIDMPFDILSSPFADDGVNGKWYWDPVFLSQA